MTVLTDKKLTDLNAKFFGAGGAGITNADGSPVEERHGLGLMCDCPCGCGTPMMVPFANPLDGKPQREADGWRVFWSRVGDTIDTLTLTPSVLRAKDKGGCGWHGFITSGVARTC